MAIVLFLIKFINAIISSLVVFPIYLILKRFFDEKETFYLTILISIYPALFMFSSLVMAENILYLFYISTLVFAYLFLEQKKLKWLIFTIFFSILAILTKGNALSLIPLIIFLLAEYKKKYSKWIISFLVLLVGLILVYPNILPISLFFGTGYSATLNNFSRNLIQIGFWSRFLLYTGLVAASTFFIPFILFLITPFTKKDKEYQNLLNLYKIIIIPLFFLLIIACNNTLTYTGTEIFKFLPGRPIARYLEMIAPLILILGFIQFKRYSQDLKALSKPILYLIIPLSFLASILVLFPMFPTNNISLSYIGAVKVLFDFILTKQILTSPLINLWFIPFFTILFVLFCIFILKYKQKLKLFFILFLITNLFAYAFIFYSSELVWSKNPYIVAGDEISDLIEEDSTLFINEAECLRKISKEDYSSICEPSKLFTLVGLKINNEIIITSKENILNSKINNSYLITKQEENLTLVKKVQPDLNLYIL